MIQWRARQAEATCFRNQYSTQCANGQKTFSFALMLLSRPCGSWSMRRMPECSGCGNSEIFVSKVMSEAIHVSDLDDDARPQFGDQFLERRRTAIPALQIANIDGIIEVVVV